MAIRCYLMNMTIVVTFTETECWNLMTLNVVHFTIMFLNVYATSMFVDSVEVTLVNNHIGVCDSCVKGWSEISIEKTVAAYPINVRINVRLQVFITTPVKTSFDAKVLQYRCSALLLHQNSGFTSEMRYLYTYI